MPYLSALLLSHTQHHLLRGYSDYFAYFMFRSEVWRRSLVYIVNERLIMRVIFTILLGIAALELIVCLS